ncbi:DivIVA domain-containing protein [Amycolatopsis solani]|uniref:DivIVA domain-containing protein n=1 Tax=Amycolatopsis solani TaxID=3028615 RepID=UPI0025B274B4|nr:hypothetical protein [Amycolatopsis sp. MEP2-6]
MAEDPISVSGPVTDSPVRFSVVLRGYDRRQVDEYVQALQERVARQGQALADAEARLADGGVPHPRPSPEPAAPGIGASIDKLLGVAEAEATAIRAAAEREAAEIRAGVRGAAEEAEALRGAAEADAKREAGLIIARAEEEAAGIRAAHRELTGDLDRIAARLARLREPSTPAPDRADMAPSSAVGGADAARPADTPAARHDPTPGGEPTADNTPSPQPTAATPAGRHDPAPRAQPAADIAPPPAADSADATRPADTPAPRHNPTPGGEQTPDDTPNPQPTAATPAERHDPAPGAQPAADTPGTSPDEPPADAVEPADAANGRSPKPARRVTRRRAPTGRPGTPA